MILVPNVKVHIPNPKGTSRVLFIPQYEVPLLEAVWRGSIPDPSINRITAERIPAKGSAAARCELTGRDRFIGCRVTRIHSLAAEKRRLASKYELHPKTGEELFSRVYPVMMFEETAARLYPGLFDDESGVDLRASDRSALDDLLGGSEEEPQDEDAQEDEPQELPPPPPLNGERVYHTETLEDLCVLKHVSMKTAQNLVDAGFTTIDDIAQTDPDELAEKVRFLGKKQAAEVVEHAIMLSLGDEDENPADEA